MVFSPPLGMKLRGNTQTEDNKPYLLCLQFNRNASSDSQKQSVFGRVEKALNELLEIKVETFVQVARYEH